MKKSIIFLSLLVALGAAASNSPNVNEKVLKAFNQTFSHATNVVWHELQNTFVAQFTFTEINSRATYDKDGNLLNTTRYYYEENLPTHILVKLKKRFSGKSIFGITEITANDEVTYYITLEDDKGWYSVESDGWANMAMVNKLKKSK